MSTEFVGDFSDAAALTLDGEADIPSLPIKAWVWIGWAVAALCVLTFTAAPGIALPLFCMAFCVQEAFNAEIVRNAHPKPAQGRIIGRFHIAYGLWKTSVAAFVGMIVLGITVVIVVNARTSSLSTQHFLERLAESHLLFLLFTMLVGFTLSAAFVIVATIGAIRHGARVWLGTFKNRVRILFWWTVLYATLFCIFGTLIAISAHRPPLKTATLEWVVTVVSVVIGVTVIFGMAFGSLMLADYLESRIIATDPKQVWPLKKPQDSLD